MVHRLYLETSSKKHNAGALEQLGEGREKSRGSHFFFLSYSTVPLSRPVQSMKSDNR